MNRRLDERPAATRIVVVGSIVLVGTFAALRQGLAEAMTFVLHRSPGPERLLAAVAVVAAYATFSFVILRTHWRKARDEARALREIADATAGPATGSSSSGAAASSISPASMLVAFASQTGFAERLARQTGETLASAGLPMHVVSLAHLDAATLARAGRVLFVVSTTGEGDAPDSVAGFVGRVMAQPAALAGLHYGLLALGDRGYEQYCAFGHALDAWLRQSGATPLFDLVDVDDGDARAIERWQQHLGTLAGRSDLAAWQGPRHGTWRLAERHLLNAGSPGAPAFHVVLDMPAADAAAGSATWRAGDIAEISPRHAPDTVADFLRAIGREPHGATLVDIDGRVEPFAQALAACVLPYDEAQRAMLARVSAQEAIAKLDRLPTRDYSIASLPDNGRLELLVRQVRDEDGRLGLGSGWLTAHAPVGGDVALRVRENRAFHPPEADCPLILIGNGTGLAGLRAHLAARAAASRHRNWLLFGERTAAHDFFFRRDLENWRARGVLSRLDVAFSRDEGTHRYVQELVLAAAAEVRAWVADGAAIYVCGSLRGMSAGVHAALIAVLGRDLVESLVEAGRYRRDVY